MSKKTKLIPSLVNIICGYSMGYQTGILSGIAVPLIKYTFFNGDLSEKSLSVYSGFYTASALFGMVIGSTIGAPIADKFGRKNGLYITAITNLIPTLIVGLVKTYALSFIFRFLIGLSVGIGAAIGPLYATENVPDDFRGFTGCVTQNAVCFGLFFSYIINYIFGKGEYGSSVVLEDWQWQWQYLLGLHIGILMMILFYFTPESPSYLENRNKPKEEKKEKINVPIAFKVKYYTIGLIIGAQQQFTGINSILYYAPTIFEQYGIISPLIGTILIVGLINWLAVFVAMYLADKIPRRPYMLASFLGIVIGNIIMAIAFFVKNGIVSIIGIVLFLIAFETGTGPLFWVIAPEMFPDIMRGPGLSMSLIANWTSNILVSLTFPILKEAIGGGPCFVIWASISFLSLIFLYVFLPESSGKLKNIDDMVSLSAQNSGDHLTHNSPEKSNQNVDDSTIPMDNIDKI